MKRAAVAKSSDISLALESWYAQSSGAELLSAYRERLQTTLELAFGYHILQTGPLPRHNLISGSPISHHILASDSAMGGPGVLCHADELPFESDSMDMVLAFHTLEFSAHPHACLREMQRVLRPRGHLVVVGFNPNSLPGLLRRLRGLRGDHLWSRHHPVGLHRLTDWLHLLDCEVDSVRQLYPISPRGSGRLRRAIDAFDRWAMRFDLPGGGVYLAHAIKQIPGARRPRPVAALGPKQLVGLSVSGRPSPAPSSPASGSSASRARVIKRPRRHVGDRAA
ncbi:MAG: class I SAM-dependent methyltransferase [Halieaceae bacterium]|jgi:SAM-dependent methyltransferase|nr:class I SAM-dependent methyltransferase [Halieaceae bacterium]